MTDDYKQFLEPTYPLLERFKDLAPGSAKHCQNVMHLSEAIAVEMGLNVDLLRCASLYHDLGKMNNPVYFSENQEETNPHDELDAFLSYKIITSHVGDSIILLLQIQDMPRDVMEVISQHHGNTILASIFKKSKSSNEDAFRYRCSRPTTDESAVLMISDSVEAIARSLFNAGKLENGDRKKVVENTVSRLIDDGQLDDMKIGFLKQTKVILIREISNIYHKRVDYDEEEERKVGRKTKASA